MLVGDLVVESVRLLSVSEAEVAYSVVDEDIAAPYTIGVYRSVDAAFNASDALLGSVVLDASQLMIGAHTVVVTFGQPRGIDPSLDHVIAVGDPDGSVAEVSDANNSASLRVWVVGAVTHGFVADGQFPAWVSQMTAGLTAQGFDVAIPFDWASSSNVPVAGVVPQVAQAMAGLVGQSVGSLALGSNDVVDVQLIGFSRGGGVVSAAAGLLPTFAPPFVGGNLKLTLLDPHPARNGGVPYFSVSSGPVGVLSAINFVAFQEGAADPEVSIPANVTQAEVFFQNTLAQNAIGFVPDEFILMSWGTVPVAGTAAQGTTYYDLTAVVRSHEGIHEFYTQQVVPVLGTGGTVPLPPVGTPGIPTNGGPSFRTFQAGRRYELGLLRQSGTNAWVANHTLFAIRKLDESILGGRLPRARRQLMALTRFVSAQSGRTIPAATANGLLGLFAQTDLLLNPPDVTTGASRARKGAGRGLAARR
jgi:hypothetical protein